MGLFFRRKNKKSGVTRDSRVDLHAQNAGARAFARERVRKTQSTKFFAALRASVVIVLSVLFLGGMLGVLGLIGYSLKSGGELTLSEKISGFLRTTPLKFLVGEDTKVISFDVIGVADVPEIPASSFVFADYITRIGVYGFQIKSKSLTGTDAQALYDFLTNGQSVYRLPPAVDWSEVQKFYQQELPKRGWKHELSVPMADTEKMPGEYYTKDEKGLHIYTVAADVWYETITKTEAEQGLHGKIVAYKAKQELVEAASGRDLPVEAVWKLRYSRDWDVELSRNTIYGVNSIYFTNGVSRERVSIAVVNRYRGNMADLTYKDIEKVGVEYISTWLTTQQTTVTLTGFTKKELIVADGKALEYSDVKNRAYFLFLVNKKNSLYYVVQYVGKENPEFFEYVKGNLKN
jgi:hypothetical protein